MTLRHTLLATGLALAGAVMLAIWMLQGERPSGVQQLRSSLKLEVLPPAAKVLKCWAPFTSDLIVDCYAEIAPHSFPELLRGWRFTEYLPNVAKDGTTITDSETTFSVHRIYSADITDDPRFTHGGAFYVYVNENRSLIRAYLYIE